MNGVANNISLTQIKRGVERRIGNFHRTSSKPYRLLTSSFRATPSFIIIGTQKGGTTSLYNYLAKHPNVEPAFQKEIHFFSKYYDNGFNWYRSNFPFYKPDFITGEASPNYIFCPYSPKRVFEALPDVKLIVLLRNPVDRAFSHYHHKLRGLQWIKNPSVEVLSFEEEIAKESERLRVPLEQIAKGEAYSDVYIRFSYLAKGIYLPQLLNWSKFFSKEQLLVLESEAFFTQTAKVFETVLEFLSLPKWSPGEFPVLNKIERTDMSVDTRQRLVEYFKPYNRELYEYLGVEFDWDK